MYDAWAPALEAYDAAVADGRSARPSRPRRQPLPRAGTRRSRWSPARAARRYLGERSAGHQDPGATSTTLLLESAARTLS